MKFALSTKQGPVEFESDLTDGQVAAELETKPGDFAADLARAYREWGWSFKQQAWAHYLVNPASQKPRPVSTGFDAIVAMFDRAAESRKFPKIAFECKINAEPTRVVLKRAGARSSKPGTVTVTNGEAYGAINARFFGRIDRDGATTISEPAVLDLLRHFTADPEGVAARYGKETGTCCFCQRTLTDPQSIAAGFGPICAEKWGLADIYQSAVA